MIVVAAGAIALAAGTILAGATPAVAESPPEGPPPFLLKWGSRGTLGGEFENTYDVATDSQGNVYVTDGRNSTGDETGAGPGDPVYIPPNDRIQKFDPYGNFLAAWGWDVTAGDAVTGFQICTVRETCKEGARGNGLGQFSSPRGIAIDRFDDDVYVTDANNNRVQKFDSDGRLLAKWGGAGTDETQFDHPRGVATDTAGNVYVVEAGNNRIQKFTGSGRFLAAWGWDVAIGPEDTDFETCDPGEPCKAGEPGSGEGQFNSPFGIAVDSGDNVFVTDVLNHRVQKLDANGNFLAAWGGFCDVSKETAAGECDSKLNEPRDIDVDSTGDLYIVDGRNYRVQKLSPSGDYITEWGRSGSDDGQFGLTDSVEHSPYGLAIGPSGDVYVADTWNRRIQKFGVDPAFAIAPTAHDFGDHPIAAGPTSARTFTVTNAGGDRLDIGVVDLIGGDADQFQKTANDCVGRALAPSESCTVSVSFDPASAGSKQAELRVSYDAAGSQTEVALQGTGTYPAVSPVPVSPVPAFLVPVSPAPIPTTPVSPTPEVIVAKRKIAVGKSAAFSIDVVCPAQPAQACQGRIEASAKVKKKRKPVVVSSARYSVLPGAKAAIAVKLNKVGIGLIKTRRLAGRIPVTLTARSAVAGNAAIAPTRTVLVLKGKGMGKRKTRRSGGRGSR